MDSPVHYHGIDFPSEAKESDALVVVAHPLVRLLKQGNHHLSLPVQRHHLGSPRFQCVCSKGVISWLGLSLYYSRVTPYSIKHFEVTAVVIWSYVNGTELN